MGSQRSKFKSPFFWLMLGAAVAFSILLITSRQLLIDTWEVLGDSDLRLVLLLPLIQVANYFFIGGYYRTMFGFFETRIKWRRAWGVVASLNFVNQILPSGGLSGITYLAYGFRAKVDVGKTSMIQIGRYIFAFTSYALIGPFALALLFADGDGNFVSEIMEKIRLNPYAIVTFSVFILLVILVISLIRSRALSLSFVNGLRRVINTITKPFVRKKKELIDKKMAKKLVDDFHEGLDFFKAQKASLLKPYGFMLMSALMELMIVFTAVKAVGGDVSFAAVFASFLAANIAGVISIVPGDVGVHEAVMTTMLVAFGLSAPEALSAVLLYRVFNKVIFLPIGFYFYSVLLKPAKESISK